MILITTLIVPACNAEHDIKYQDKNQRSLKQEGFSKELGIYV